MLVGISSKMMMTPLLVLSFLSGIHGVSEQSHGTGTGTQTTPTLRYEAPDDCQWWLRDTLNEVTLICTLQTINSELETTNFSVIPSEHTTSLRIQCNPDSKIKSSLDDRSFAHLIKLRELVLDHCKLAKWPAGTLIGLDDLRNLTVRTHNIDWSSTSLEIAPESFLTVRQLERLDLAFNNIWSFPESVFCPLTNLALLNVSRNRLQDVGDLGFREKPPPPQSLLSASDEGDPQPGAGGIAPCTLDIQILDASRNHFVLIPGNGFSALRRLKELYVRDNEISVVAEKALAGLKNLEVLDLSDNKVVALPPELFQDASDSIKEIYLHNNSISVLASGLFSNLKYLTTLDLSRNRLTSAWITATTFSGLIRLVLLNLGHNRISQLDPSLFNDLYTLQILNLEHNEIDTLLSGTFAPMKNLHTLILSHNKINSLDVFSLNDLSVLSLLSLDNNVIERIQGEAFKNLSSLQDLNLNGNGLTEIPNALGNLPRLRTVDLGENSITKIKELSFVGLVNLYGLRLIGNGLTEVTKKSFSNLPELQILNLARNKISKVEKGSFESNKRLQAIRLDANLLTDVDGLFSNVKSLLWLNISDNRLEKFDYSLVPKTLQWLDLHGNSIKELGNRFFLASELQIQTLDASFNKLTSITAISVPDSVELLFLNNNLINHVEPHTFLKKVNLTRVDLYANEIVSMELNALRLSPVDAERPLPEFYIGGNPFQCDCTMEWLQRINTLDHLRQHPRVMDFESIFCKLLYNRDRDYVSLVDIDSSQFLCTYKFHCFALCQCCDFDACDCEMTCPRNCTCYHDQSWTSNIVVCSGAEYTRMPTGIPMDATEVYIDGMNLVELTSHAFLGRKNLKVLYANNSDIAVVNNHTFSGLKKLSVLHLENNRIKELSGFEFTSLENLKELYLQGNEIYHIDNRTFSELRQVQVIRLDNNKLRTFRVWEFSLNPYLVKITLSGNQWSCNCQYLQQFRNWLQPNYYKVPDAEKIICVFNNVTNLLGPPVADFNSTTCSAFTGDSRAVIESPVIQDYLPLLLATFCIFLISITIVCSAFYYRRELRVWIYSKCGLRMCYKTAAFEEEQDRDRLFDAYVSYSVKDENFVNQVLAPGLEQSEPRYRLCLHYRDFNVSAYIADTIVEAVESSRRTIVILSKNFLHSEWCRFEFKSALHEVLKDRRKRLIVIMLGEVAQRDLDPDLRLYLKTNTCIEWGDRLFWPKLRFAMPDVKKKNCSSTRHSGPHLNVNVYSASSTPNSYDQTSIENRQTSGKLLPTSFVHHQNNLQNSSQQHNRRVPQSLWA